MIFYFSATRNSMYVARQIEKDPISIPRQYLSKHHGSECAAAHGE